MRASMALALCLFAVGCTDEGDGVFVAEADDEAVDPDDPPDEPDPLLDSEQLPDVVGSEVVPTEEQVIAAKAQCPKQTRTLSPAGLTFAIHISKKEDNGWAAYRQLRRVRHLIRARDVFVIEGKSPWVLALQNAFPCNEVHLIAYPEEVDKAYEMLGLIDSVAVDWERAVVWTSPQSFTVDKLTGYAAKFHAKGLGAGVVPYWPGGFNDGHITRASHMNYELAQIQNRCAHDGADAYASAARGLIVNFRDNGMGARDIGFEISNSSVPDADNHTGVARSAACTRKAYGKGARAIYLYGNGTPHLEDYFKAIAKLGIRTAR
jgi:hypothetical protein